MTSQINFTSIDLLDDGQIEDQTDKYNFSDPEDIEKTILDLTKSIQCRFSAIRELSKYYLDDVTLETLGIPTFDQKITELVSRLTGMYQMSGVRSVEIYLIQLVSDESPISTQLKFQILKALSEYRELEDEDIDENFEENEMVGMRNKERLNRVQKSILDFCDRKLNLPSPCRLELLLNLLESNEEEEILYDRFRRLISDKNVDCGFRYDSILSIEKKYRHSLLNILRSNLGNLSISQEILDKQASQIKRDYPDFKVSVKNTRLIGVLLSSLESVYCKELCDRYTLNLENPIKFENIMFKCLLSFFFMSDNDVYFKILAGQNLLQNFRTKIKDGIEDSLLKISKNPSIDYNRRADAADVLITLGSERQRNEAVAVIRELGISETTVFENAQNVHTSGIEQSVNEIVEYLIDLPTKRIGDLPIDIEYVSSNINSFYKENTKPRGKLFDSSSVSDLEKALDRIRRDRILYSRYNTRLDNLLVKLWSFIVSHESSEQLKIRLIEELIEMSQTCTTGFISRIANVISGFSDFSVHISWEEQICGNLMGRMTARLGKVKETMSNRYSEIFLLYMEENTEVDPEVDPDLVYSEFVDNVTYELSVPPSSLSSRKNFSLFFRSHIAQIREEMYSEFKEYLDDTTFDLYMRKALMKYDGC